ncbi:metal-dependent hydrolase family protein [Pseudoalteromonas denitrificans]|uniref:Pro-Hyp dipeptidase. Metallo peptidase. MEROPS family M38 n=1 Tax=Pseudoalteromonas denitrificans DSM 6059 TaxID=1123010 RepID=A0A1I1RK26_9GAMM|nr:amidohydrolase family protein [Pseudoalteromonas denitrificans]SFD34387.1 Pro-Hyp dipeptidase. Metallo peptidase. MEROPS family M38 [Pseudoalteromonas denitrificans DSM 6059]
MKLFIKAACITALSLSSIVPMQLLAQIQVIHAGELLAVPGSPTLKKYSLIVTNNIITDVKKGFIKPSDISQTATLIDLSSRFVLPGLMDMHVHLQGEFSPKNDSEKLRMSDADKLVKSAYFAKKTLMAGFTTVRDLGGSPEQSFALRDGIQKGFLDGPRIIAAGSNVAVTGGHGDVDGMSPDLLDIHTAETICDGPYDCRRATRRAIKYGADVIKITSTGGVLSDTDTGTGQQMADDELREVVNAAHALGRKVASHAHAAAGINAALRAGVDSIEHGSYANDESIQLFKQTGAYLVPTLMAGDTVVDMAKNSNFMSPAIAAKAIRVGSDMIANFKHAFKSGVKIAYGTDSGVSPHGNNAREAILMYQIGMTPNEIIKSATINAADLIGKSKSLGSLEVGKIADIIAVNNSPIKNIEALLDVDFVMKSGKIIKNK